MWDMFKQFFSFLAQTIVDAVAASLAAMLGVFVNILAWVFSMLSPLARKGIVTFLDYFEIALNFLPVPDFIAVAHAHWAAMPWSELGFFLGPFEVGFGFSLIFGAALLKFFLRLLPGIGVLWRSPS